MLALLASLLLALHFDAPKEFLAERPATSMQVERWRLPAAEGASDGLLVVYFFGRGQGGTPEANVARWLSQFPEKDGEPVVEKGKTKSGLALTTVDVSGTEAAATPMNPSPERHKGWRLIGAIIEAPDGNYFVKATGPKATIERHAGAIRAYIESARP